MVKKWFVLLCVVFCVESASAQVTWNMRAGSGVSFCNYDYSEYWGHCHPVGKIGIGLEKPLARNWSLMPALEFAWISSHSDCIDDIYGLDHLFLRMNFLAAYRFNLSYKWNLVLKIGSFLNYALLEIYKEYNRYEEYKEIYLGNFVDFGLCDFGVDFEYRRCVFGLEYYLGYRELYDSYNCGTLCATVGFKF